MHVPVAIMVTLVPLTVQTLGVFELYVTANPEDAAASGLMANVPDGAYERAGTDCAGKLIVWLLVPMLKVCCTGVAAL